MILCPFSCTLSPMLSRDFSFLYLVSVLYIIPLNTCERVHNLKSHSLPLIVRSIYKSSFLVNQSSNISNRRFSFPSFACNISFLITSYVLYINLYTFIFLLSIVSSSMLLVYNAIKSELDFFLQSKSMQSIFFAINFLLLFFIVSLLFFIVSLLFFIVSLLF